MIEPSNVPPRLTVLVAEDHPVMREGLVTLLEQQPDFVVIGGAASARETRTAIERQPPDLLLMDLMMQEDDGLALIKDLVTLVPALRIVVFSLQPEDIYAERCLRAGAHGYVMKREPVDTLFRAVRDVAAGGIAVSPRIAATVIGGLTGHARQPAGAETRLTDRELQVFRLVGLGLATRDIAEKLNVSFKTIETHRENIKNKLGLQTHTELVARAATWAQESATG
ncbi:MAG: response regulator transcription factor [Opitutaceae bacterium]|nr:response regulator transcription factor [Opitutaceae bacterium]MBP9912146.1 response regulator transcription factor [Opitutaceae bacterium]